MAEEDPKTANEDAAGTGAAKAASETARKTASKTTSESGTTKPRAAAAPAGTAATQAKTEDRESAASPADASPSDRGAGEKAAERAFLGRPSGRFAGLALAIVVIAAAGVVWLWQTWRLSALLPQNSEAPAVVAEHSHPPPSELSKFSERVAALEAAVARLGADVAALKSAPPPPAASPDAVQSLDARIAAVEKRLEATPGGAPEGAAVEPRLVGLEKALAELSGRLAQAEPRRETAGTLALMALSGALRTGIPFKALLAPARTALEGPEGEAVLGRIGALAGHADKGVPGRDRLVRRFAALTRDRAKPVPAEKPPPRSPGFWDKVTAQLGGLVKIRRVGEPDPKGGDPWAAAEPAMAADDLASAVSALSGVKGADTAAWRRDAEARIAADELAIALDARIAARLGAAAQGPQAR